MKHEYADVMKSAMKTISSIWDEIYFFWSEKLMFSTSMWLVFLGYLIGLLVGGAVTTVLLAIGVVALDQIIHHPCATLIPLGVAFLIWVSYETAKWNKDIDSQKVEVSTDKKL